MSYATDDHAGWLRETYNLTVSPTGEKVAYVLGVVGGGLYNCPFNPENIEWNNDGKIGISVLWKGSMATHDPDKLSLIVLLCAHLGLRLTIAPASPLCMRLTFHERDQRGGTLGKRLPDIEDVVRDFRRVWPELPGIEPLPAYLKAVEEQAALRHKGT